MGTRQTGTQKTTGTRQAATRRGYNTEQRRLVSACLDAGADRYQTVDEVYETLREQGSSVGRTTVYRTLERMAADGTVSKVVGAPGTSALYRKAGEAEQGQLLCLECGRVFPLDCGMLASFDEHVREHHGFAIDQRRTVICGVCEQCLERDGRNAEGQARAAEGHDHAGTADKPPARGRGCGRRQESSPERERDAGNEDTDRPGDRG